MIFGALSLNQIKNSKLDLNNILQGLLDVLRAPKCVGDVNNYILLIFK